MGLESPFDFWGELGSLVFWGGKSVLLYGVCELCSVGSSSAESDWTGWRGGFVFLCTVLSVAELESEQSKPG